MITPGPGRLRVLALNTDAKTSYDCEMENDEVGESARSREAGEIERDILIDGHVHLHACFALPELLDAAAKNFEAAAQSLKIDNGACCVLLLCEDEGYERFLGLVEKVETQSKIGGWSVSTSSESTVMVARHDNGRRLFIIAGRQIQTREGLELLALCTDFAHADGLALDVSIAEIRQTGGIAVLPWGFGKWLGKRGKEVMRLINGPPRHRLLLGDNSGRLAGLRDPTHFQIARRLGMSILSGTDPLPFPSQQLRVGKYGSYLRGQFDEGRASASIRSLLQDSRTAPITYGNRERPAAFLANQLRMQIKKRCPPRGIIVS